MQKTKLGKFLFLLLMFSSVIIPLFSLVIHSKADPDPSTIDLNALMLSKFQDWDAMLTGVSSTNGTIYDPYPVDNAPTYNIKSLYGDIGMLSLMSFYNGTKDEYYLRKLQCFIDNVITDSFFKVSTDKGIIHYLPSYYQNGGESDYTPKITMFAGVSAVKLYQWTGLTKYKQLATDIATESMKLITINNSTDMAWHWGYYLTPRTEANAKVVNRQGSIAFFYAVYGSVINSTYLSYIPKILNWMWRAQLSSGGLEYEIGDGYVNIAYTSYSIFFAMTTYQYAPSQFSSGIKAEITNTLNWLQTLDSSLSYNELYVRSASYAMAIKTGFVVSPEQEFLGNTKFMIYTALQMMNIRKQGLVTTVEYYAFGYSWAQFFVNAFFYAYALPTNLKTYSPTKFLCTNWGTGRVKSISAWLGSDNDVQLRYGDNGDRVGIDKGTDVSTWLSISAYPWYCYTRSYSNETTYLKGWLNASNYGLYVLSYFYSSNIVFVNVTGTSTIQMNFDFAANAKLRVSNGTVYDLSTMNNGTKVFGNEFLVWRNTSFPYRESRFIYTAATTTWSFTRAVSSIKIEKADLVNYQATEITLAGWALFGDNSTKIYNSLHNLVMAHHSLTPVPYDNQISNWKTEVNSLTDPNTWFDTYKTATTSTVKLIAHSNPEKVSLSAWTYGEGKLTFTISAPSGTTSTTKIYMNNKVVKTVTGASSYSYDEATQILTITKTHSSLATITIEFEVVGDVNHNGIVDVQDLFIIAKAFGSIEGEQRYNPDADINKDGIVDTEDLAVVQMQYGKDP